MMTDARQARRVLQHADATARRAADLDPRPYGRALITMAILQFILFCAFAVALAFDWSWISILIIAIATFGLALWAGSRRARKRGVVPEFAAAAAHRVELWSGYGTVVVALVVGLLTPDIGFGGVGPIALLVPLVGAVVVLPRMILGVKLWRR